MAYRRRQGGMSRWATLKEDKRFDDEEDEEDGCDRSLAAQAIRASSSHRLSSSSDPSPYNAPPHCNKVFDAYEDATARNNGKGFWGVVARKAKAMLDVEDHIPDSSTSDSSPYLTPHIRNGLHKITSSLNQIGDTFEKALEEGRTKLEDETRKLQIRRKGSGLDEPNLPQNQMNNETQLKASRDVAMATAAKAKLLLRELKSVKADLAFAKLRCSQLEEENKVLREGRDKSGNAADDDLIRLQLEALLAEKARLAHENSIYSRENRFLREIVEYHQLTMQDVVYVDEGSEEVTQVHPYGTMLSNSPPSPIQDMSASSTPPPLMNEIFPVPTPPTEEDHAA